MAQPLERAARPQRATSGRKWPFEGPLRGHCRGKLGIHVRRVHLARDESYALIRLADACAGLAREAEEGHQEAATLSRRGQRKGVIVVA